MNTGVLFLIHIGLLFLGGASITDVIAAYKNGRYFRCGLWTMIAVNLIAMSVCVLVYLMWFTE